MLQIAFETRSLRTVCEDESQARREYEPCVVDALQRRLADLRAASTVEDVLVGHPRAVDGVGEDCMQVDLEGSWRIVFAANHPKNPRTASGVCDWAKITRVRILRIENCDA